jgi:hypothetical protein
MKCIHNISADRRTADKQYLAQWVLNISRQFVAFHTLHITQFARRIRRETRGNAIEIIYGFGRDAAAAALRTKAFFSIICEAYGENIFDGICLSIT